MPYIKINMVYTVLTKTVALTKNHNDMPINIQQGIDIDCQDSPEQREVIRAWLKERDDLRNYTKGVFNPRFGSLFRTYHNPTYFTRRLARFADMYMSSLTNLLHYSVDHSFYPHRVLLPHEPGPFSKY
ncbi:5'-nucleotidase domain-containing protein 2-like [Haliotis rufescens]|uniref:5'-nucleotidase domain-containing protein 2-like n=1 Tax=Haliotis rufescens TaxID=6454 RepID=UPI00201F0B9E|nr:5'-nucleotidase domain-containing protein 2-like [Haliotis rufescens]